MAWWAVKTHMEQAGGPWDLPLPDRDPYLGQVLSEHLLKDIPEPMHWPPGPPPDHPQADGSPGRESAHMVLPSSPGPPPLGSLWERNSSDTLEMH